MSTRVKSLAKRVLMGRQPMKLDAALQEALGEVERLRAELGTLQAGMPSPDGALAPVWLLPLDYPITPRSRHGHGQPTHAGLAAILEEARPRFEGWARAMAAHAAKLHTIPVEAPEDGRIPHWNNGWLSPQDASSLYTIVADTNPALYIEVGSGNSTLFTRRAINDHGLRTKLVSIDPMPRAEVDEVCDEVVRQPFEDCDLSVFDRVSPGDVVFVDNSHRSFTNSDVTVFMLEVLPTLPPGVLVHIHDIFLPDDYPPDWSNRFYSEQYLLAAMLLGGHRTFDVEFPGWHVGQDATCNELLAPLLDGPRSANPGGGSFWVRTKA